MLPETPAILRHPTENILFWAEDAAKLEEIPFGAASAKAKSIGFAEELSDADYKRAIESGLGNTPERLAYLRMRMWWTGNDAIREGTKHSLSADHLENLAAFALLLSEMDDNQRIMKAEALRELGRFSESEALLNHPFPDGYRKAVTLIGSLVRVSQTRVAKISS